VLVVQPRRYVGYILTALLSAAAGAAAMLLLT
jgi:hypothetical protein